MLRIIGLLTLSDVAVLTMINKTTSTLPEIPTGWLGTVTLSGKLRHCVLQNEEKSITIYQSAETPEAAVEKALNHIE